MLMTLKNGKVKIILRERDFACLLEEYMGHEAAEFYLSLVEDRDDLRADRNRLWEDNDELREEINRLEDEMNDLLDDLHNIREGDSDDE